MTYQMVCAHRRPHALRREANRSTGLYCSFANFLTGLQQASLHTPWSSHNDLRLKFKKSSHMSSKVGSPYGQTLSLILHRSGR